MPAERPKADFGARLRAAREGRGTSLRAIADATKISVRALEALERNDISHLPGGIFSRAFVRAYSIEIGLDPEKTIADFITRFPDDSVTQGHPKTRALVDEVERVHRRSRRRTTPYRLVLIAVPVLGAAAYLGLGARRSAPVTSSPSSPSLRSLPGSPGSPSSAAAEASAPPVTPPPVPAPAVESLTVAIDATRPCTITVAVDGGQGMVIALGAGAGQQFTAVRELTLSASDPSAVRWTINGAPAAPLTGTVRVTPGTIAGLLALR
jgi:cytoskeletal protein RodZ